MLIVGIGVDVSNPPNPGHRTENHRVIEEVGLDEKGSRLAAELYINPCVYL